jgi:hypothetical protein
MNSFAYIFTFVGLWTLSLALYYTDAYVDYLFQFQIWLTSIPSFFTFLAISVAIENFMQIYLLLVKSSKTKVHIERFRILAFFCVLT